MSCIILEQTHQRVSALSFSSLPSLSPSLPLIWLHWTQFTFFLYYKLTIKIESWAEVTKNLAFFNQFSNRYVPLNIVQFWSSSIHAPVTISTLHTLDLYYVQSSDVQKQCKSDFQLLIINLLNYTFNHPPMWLLPKAPTELKVYCIKTSWLYSSICCKTFNTGKFSRLW